MEALLSRRAASLWFGWRALAPWLRGLGPSAQLRVPRADSKRWASAGGAPGLLLLTTVLLGASGVASAQAPVTEVVVAQRARSRALLALVVDLRAARARAAADHIPLQPNPGLEWEHQAAFAPNAQTQDLLWAQIPIDPSGRRRAERELLRLDAIEAEAEAAVVRAEVVAEALGLFYRALGAERRLELLEATQATLDEAARIAQSREEAGEGSGYVTARLALEASLGRSAVEEARVESDALRTQLMGWLGLAAGAPLEGTFAVTPPTAPGDASERPEARAVAGLVDQAAESQRAARAGWVPRLGVAGSYNRQAQGDVVGHGYGTRVEVELPLFDRGQREAAEADAAAEVIAAYDETFTDTLSAELRAARERLLGLLLERARLAETLDQADALMRAAEAGFREGERTLVELIDARRAALAAHERLLALDVAVRMADIEHRRAAGGLR